MSTHEYVERVFAQISKEKHNPLDEKFAKLVEKNLKRFNVPSVTIAIVDGDETYSAGYGIAELPSTKATPSTLYMTGSTTKSFTALSLLQLIETGSQEDEKENGIPITVNSTVSSILPEFRLNHPYLSTAATIEDILSHRTGLPRHDLSYFNDGDTIEDLLARLPHLPLTAEPRTKWQYNNLMYAVASAILERLSGKTTAEYFTSNIWSKLDMNSTFLSIQDALDFVHKKGKPSDTVFARGYFWDEDKEQFLLERWMDAPSVSGAGHTISSVLDYAKYLRALINGSDGVISEKSKTELRTARSIMPPSESPPRVGDRTYTLGWMKEVLSPGIEVYNHDGGLGGFGAHMSYVPSLKWGAALFSNTALSSNFLEQAIMRTLLDEKLGAAPERRLDHFEIAAKSLAKAIESEFKTPESLFPDLPSKRIPLSLPIESYAGSYKSPGYGPLTIKLVDDDGTRDLKKYDENSSSSDSAKGASKVLHLEHLTKAPWNFMSDFEHVSGEYFLLKSRAPEDDPHLVKKYYKAQFRLNVDGTVQQVGIGWVEELKDLIWYNRIRHDSKDTKNPS